jgi:hypothetical protein
MNPPVIREEDGALVIDFPPKLSGFGMTKDDAQALASAILTFLATPAATTSYFQWGATR